VVIRIPRAVVEIRKTRVNPVPKARRRVMTLMRNLRLSQGSRSHSPVVRETRYRR